MAYIAQTNKKTYTIYIRNVTSTVPEIVSKWCKEDTLYIKIEFIYLCI